MTIQITRPEIETLINQRLECGGFKDAEDVIFQALKSSEFGEARIERRRSRGLRPSAKQPSFRLAG